jgi:hypothetical protein
MPFDPTLPANNSPVSSAEVRGQLTALNQAIEDTGSIAAESLSNALVDVNSTIDNQVATQTAGNINGFAVPNLTISDPPTRAEVQQIADMLHDLVILLQRGS